MNKQQLINRFVDWNIRTQRITDRKVEDEIDIVLEILDKPVPEINSMTIGDYKTLWFRCSREELEILKSNKADIKMLFLLGVER
jgi:hypothetical protein